MVITVKFCCYIPWKLYINNNQANFESCIDINDDISILNKFTDDYSIYKFKNKINLIVINKDDFKRKRILPIIEDVNNNQCFIALSIQWLDYPLGYSHDLPQDELIVMLEQIYSSNKMKIDKCVDKFLHKLCSSKFEQYKISKAEDSYET